MASAPEVIYVTSPLASIYCRIIAILVYQVSVSVSLYFILMITIFERHSRTALRYRLLVDSIYIFTTMLPGHFIFRYFFRRLVIDIAAYFMIILTLIMSHAT